MEYSKLSKKIVAKLNQLSHANSLHLTRIAKAIEIESKDMIKIIFRGPPPRKVERNFTGMTITQMLKAEAKGCSEPLIIHEHFIYYAKNKDDAKARFAVAHELGHIYLHHFKKRKKRNFIAWEDNPEASFYVIDFDDIEEAEADMFASVIAHQRKMPKKLNKFVLPCDRQMLKLKKMKFLGDKLSSLLPTSTSCVKDCSPANHCFDIDI